MTGKAPKRYRTAQDASEPSFPSSAPSRRFPVRLNLPRAYIICLDEIDPYPETAVACHAAIAHGGAMYGCKNGGWMMGTAHSDPNLPPTIVRLLLQSCC